jgi:hypothetical protein
MTRLAKNKQEALAEFERAEYKDCFVNGYAEVVQRPYKQAPSLLRIILEHKQADMKNLDLVLQKISDMIGGVPTVLDSGTEFTIIQPVEIPILESLPEFKPFLWPSNLFLSFASKYLSGGLDDSIPTFDDCMLPVPGSINSKNGSVVKVYQEWDKKRPSASSLLQPFLEYLLEGS